MVYGPFINGPVTVAFDHDNAEILSILLGQASVSNKTGLLKIHFDFSFYIFTSF